MSEVPKDKSLLRLVYKVSMKRVTSCIHTVHTIVFLVILLLLNEVYTCWHISLVVVCK